MVEREFAQVRVVQNQDNRGFAAANNQGIDLANGRYVLLLNSDTVVLDGAIDKSIAFADDHPRAGVVGCRALNADRTLQPTCFMYPSPLNMLLSSTYLYKLWPRSRFFGRELMTWWDRRGGAEVEVVTGCFMLVRREAIDEVGTMDEDFFMYGEETDWCYRFREKGWQVLFAPVGEIVHLGGCSSRQAPHAMTLQLYGSKLRFVHKHRPKVYYWATCVFTALFFAFRVPYWLMRAAISGTGRGDCFRVAWTYTVGSVRALRGWESLCVRRDGCTR
jgi:hypothetical protein